jgi:acyl carrier protein
MEKDWAEERVIRFTMQDWPVRKNRALNAATRLAQDLGMDGEDAVEFFDDFQQDFGIDLEDLYLHWDQHFSPRGHQPFAQCIGINCSMHHCGILAATSDSF